MSRNRLIRATASVREIRFFTSVREASTRAGKAVLARCCNGSSAASSHDPSLLDRRDIEREEPVVQRSVRAASSTRRVPIDNDARSSLVHPQRARPRHDRVNTRARGCGAARDNLWHTRVRDEIEQRADRALARGRNETGPYVDS